jgi:hypothetical protein
MHASVTKLRRTALALLVGSSLLLSSCGGDTPPEAQPATAPAPATEAARTEPLVVPSILEATDETWTPEAMEDLLAPVALYPDKILGEVLVASTSPQEVLDAGNWRVKNESLEGKELDDAAKQVGFTPPARMLLQNPIVLDMMCSEFGWTRELGQAFVNDQAGVLDAVQRLRLQARDAGNLVTSDKMVVNTEVQEGEQAIVLSSPDPDVVYVPQYDPEVVYAPVADNDGHGTGTVVAAALIGFGAGLVLANIFDDDDDDWYDDDYYTPRYYGPPMPYYSHYPYRPVYGGGYYVSTGYVRPPSYRYSYTGTTIVRRDVDNYWNRYDDRIYRKRGAGHVKSPITKAKPNRPELGSLNEKANRGPKHRAPGKAEREANQAKKRERRDRDGSKDRDRAGGRRDAGDRDRAGGRRDAGDRDRAGRSDGGKRAKPGGGADRVRPKGGGGGGGNKGGKKQGGGRQGGGRRQRG